MLLLLPIGHETRVQRFPYVTVGLMVLNLLIMPVWYWELSEYQKLEAVAEQIQSVDPYYFERERMKDNPRMEIIEGLEYNPLELTESQIEKLRELELKLEDLKANLPLTRFGSVPARWNPVNAITSTFLHAGWLHLIGNMLFLWMVGCNMEDRWGPWFFSLFYIFGGIAASGADALSRWGSTETCVGASGAVAAVMGAFLLRYAKTKIKFFWLVLLFIYPIKGTFNAAAYIMLPLWILREIVFAHFGLQQGVANWAHIGGFAFGAGVGAVIWVSGLEEKYFNPKYSLEGEEHQVPPEYQQAHELLGQGKIEEAKGIFKKLSIREGGYLPAMISLSKIYADDNNRDELIKITETITKRALATDEMHFAVESFQRMHKVFPDASVSPALQFRMASSFAKLSLFEEAVWLYRNLAASYPNEVLAQKSLIAAGDLLAQKMGMHENAIQMYNHVIQYYSDSPMAEFAREKLKQVQAILNRPAS